MDQAVYSMDAHRFIGSVCRYCHSTHFNCRYKKTFEIRGNDMSWLDIFCLFAVTLFGIYSIYTRELRIRDLIRSNLYLSSLVEEYKTRINTDSKQVKKRGK